MIVSSGNRGDAVRSDCFVEVSLHEATGHSIRIESKVKSLYGKSIRELCQKVLDFFELKNANVFIDDKGALPFVIAARLEAAIKQIIKTEMEFLLPFDGSTFKTGKEITRRSRLYLPGNNPKLMLNAGIYGCDGIILDLEDSVAHDKKFEARFLVRNALRSVNFHGSERMVRINQLPAGLNDLSFVVQHSVNLIIIPKCEYAEQVKAVDRRISELLGKENTDIHLMPIIESALGVIHAYEIASSSPNVAALAIGLEDYTADIGAQRTNEAWESFYARSAVVNAARAAGIQPIDSVFSDIENMNALADNVKQSKAMGFVGMGCIHPRQVPVIHKYFNPNQDEIEKAQKIVDAFEKGKEQGFGVVTMGSKMIDAPVVKRAQSTIKLAVEAGLINENRRVHDGN
jgi:citrate lyase subunit beta/citryl-CoA lyase